MGREMGGRVYWCPAALSVNHGVAQRTLSFMPCSVYLNFSMCFM